MTNHPHDKYPGKDLQTIQAAAAGSRVIMPTAPRSMAPPSFSSGPDPLGLLRALRRRLGLALGLGVLALAIFGTGAWYLLPQTKYSVQATLHVAANPPQVLFRTVETQNQGNEEYKRYQKTQIAWVKSRLVLKSALDRPGIARYAMIRAQDDPIRWLQSELKVGFSEGAEIFTIGLSGDHPRELAGLVNAIKDAYLEEVGNLEQKLRRDRYDKLNRILSDMVEELKSKRDAKNRIAESVGTDDRQVLVIKQQFGQEHLAMVKKELMETQSDRRKAEVALELQQSLDRHHSVTLDEGEIQKIVESDPMLIDLRKHLGEAEMKLDRATRLARQRTDPATKAMRDEVAKTSKKIADYSRELRGLTIAKMNESATGNQRSKTQALRQEIASLEGLEKKLRTEIAELDKGTQSLNLNTLGLETIQDEIAQTEEAARKVGSEVEALEVEVQAPPRVKLLEAAVVPRMKDEKKRLMGVGAIGAGAFGLSILLVSFCEFQTRRVNSADEVVMGLGIPLVGVIPTLPVRARRTTDVPANRQRDLYWYNLMLESIDAARTMLLHSVRARGHKVILVTSALSGEGKTSLSLGLSMSLARGGYRTLLVDADLRSPTADRLFQLPPGAGLSEILRGDATIEEAVTATMVPDLDVLPAGHYDSRTIQGLVRGDIVDSFEQLRKHYDYIIVDTSPVLPIADVLLIAPHVDCALLSIFQGVSRTPKVFAAQQRLATLGVPLVGAVVTGSRGGLYGNDLRYPKSSATIRPVDVTPGEAS